MRGKSKKRGAVEGKEDKEETQRQRGEKKGAERRPGGGGGGGGGMSGGNLWEKQDPQEPKMAGICPLIY